MFLTIGDKIREAREKYGLKQIAFESYGFSRNYISMIETKKRSLKSLKNAESVEEWRTILVKIMGTLLVFS